MKLIVKSLKPRNRLVAAALLRKAGLHRVSGRSDRQVARLVLRRELDRLFKPSP